MTNLAKSCTIFKNLKNMKLEPNKLSKSEYQNLWNPKISKKDYDETIIKINARFDYIMHKICTKLKWWDYDNGWGETCGVFVPNKYHKNKESFISFHGEYSMPPPYDTCSDISISWLWSDFEEKFKEEVNLEKNRRIQEKESRAKKAAELKKKRADIKKIVSEKLAKTLTKEELKFVKIK